MLVKFTLLSELSQLAHVLDQELGNAIRGYRFAGLCLERIANGRDDILGIAS